MGEADGADGDPEGAGHDCPADPPSPAFGPASGEVTSEEKAAIHRFLDNGGAPVTNVRVRKIAWAALKFVAAASLITGVGIGLGDGNDFDDVGCGVAQQPAKVRLGAESAGLGKAAGDKVPGSDAGAAGAAGGVGDGRAGDRPECLVQAAMCQRRMPDGQCRMSGRLCEALRMQGAKYRMQNEAQSAVPMVAAKAVVKVVESAMERFERKLEAVRKLVLEVNRGGGVGSGIQVTEGEARKVFSLLNRLETGPKERKAPLGAVFRLLVLHGLSQRVVAGRCSCAESLISARVATIESGFGMPIERLRNFASELREMETAVKGERRRKKSAGAPADFEERDGADGDVFGDGGEEA